MPPEERSSGSEQSESRPSGTGAARRGRRSNRGRRGRGRRPSKSSEPTRERPAPAPAEQDEPLPAGVENVRETRESDEPVFAASEPETESYAPERTEERMEHGEDVADDDLPFPPEETRTETLPPPERELLRSAPAREQPRPQPPPARDFKPAPPAVVQDAIVEVNRIIDTLRETLDDMEEVLETLELAERQKTADEQEIEVLRRQLRQLQRPRDSGHHGHRR